MDERVVLSKFTGRAPSQLWDGLPIYVCAVFLVKSRAYISQTQDQ